MRNFARVVCAVAAVSAAASAVAQGQTTTAFDGTYRGVSRTIEQGASGSGRTVGCAPNGVPATLIIANGTARNTATQNPMQGSVTPQGALMMRTQRGDVFQGQIDSRGTVTGRLNAGCAYQYVWQRQ
jgi:hypothetical protein